MLGVILLMGPTCTQEGGEVDDAGTWGPSYGKDQAVGSRMRVEEGNECGEDE